MKPDTIVVGDVVQHFIFRIISGYKSTGGQPFRFKGTKKALCWRIIPAVALTAHGGLHAKRYKLFSVLIARILASTI